MPVARAREIICPVCGLFVWTLATPDLKLLEEALRHTEFLSDISRQNAPNHNDKYDPVVILPTHTLVVGCHLLGNKANIYHLMRPWHTVQSTAHLANPNL